MERLTRECGLSLAGEGANFITPPSFFVFILSTFHRRVDRLFSQPTRGIAISLSLRIFLRASAVDASATAARTRTNHGGRFLGRFQLSAPLSLRPRIIYRPRMTKHNLCRLCTRSLVARCCWCCIVPRVLRSVRFLACRFSVEHAELFFPFLFFGRISIR